jgi:threonine synthase
MSTNFFVKCLDCGHQSSYNPGEPSCAMCGSSWREAEYDYQSIAANLPGLLQNRAFDLWRYRELLPVKRLYPELYLGEGGTPLIRAANLGMMLGCPHLFIKDERQGPTASFKDRQAAITIAALKEAGVTEMVAASTGNVAISYSAYAARASIKLWAFLTSLVPGSKMREVAIYGTQVIKVTGSYDQAKQIAAEFARKRNLYLDSGARSIPCVESMKTIAFEIAEQLPIYNQQGKLSSNGHQKPNWEAPDWYIQSVSGGMGPLGVIKGFNELLQMGWIEKIPRFGIIQSEGCSPMVTAWKDNRETATAVKMPRTRIETLATGDPGRTYTLLRQKMMAASGGTFESVTDEEAFRAMHLAAKMEGLSIEPAAAVAFAGVIKLVRSGMIKPEQTVVINCTGHSMPVEHSILGDNWVKDVILSPQSKIESQDEGLLAALNQIAPERFPRILIADDQKEVRQLIRRILQSQGNYQLTEAHDGRQALRHAVQNTPDLIILDLMMPELDGFSVLDALHSNPDTTHIPVIIVTAKELTLAEKEYLNGQIHSLMQKGDFMSDELLNEVQALLK